MAAERPFENVEFRAQWSNAGFSTPATAALNKLRAMSAELDRINGKLAGMAVPSFKHSLRELDTMLKQRGVSAKNLTESEVARALGVPDEKNFKAAAARARAQQAILQADFKTANDKVNRLEKQMAGTQSQKKKTAIQQSLIAANAEHDRLEKKLSSSKYFRSAAAGGGFINVGTAAAFSKDYFDRLEKSQRSLFAPSGGASAAALGGIKVAGKIQLTIPASQIQAKVSGTVKAEGGQKSTSPRPSPQSGEGVIAGGALGALIQEREDSRSGEVRRKYVSGVVTTDVISGKKAGQVTTRDLRAAARESLAATGEQVRKDFDEQLAGILGGPKAGRITAINALVGKMQQQVTALGGDKSFTALPQRTVQAELKKLNTAIGRTAAVSINAVEQDLQTFPSRPLSAFYKAKAAAEAKRDKAAAGVAALEEREAATLTARRNQMQAVQGRWQNFLAAGGVETERSGRMTLGPGGQWTSTLEGQRRLPGGRMETFRATLPAGGLHAMPTAAIIPGLAAQMPKSPLASAVEGLQPENMAAKFLKVASWSAAAIPIYGAMYKALELVTYSLQRLEKTGLEMAHLGLVFRGVGGNAQELTGDILKLAAVQGQSTDEAMKSATEWARLGGDRAAVNEEVRVSAMAANLADISMEESTKQLSALLHIYKLEAGELSGVLGELTNTSLKYNASLGEIMSGMDRAAAAAKVAGISLAEIQAMIGVLIGSTGQTGAVAGTSIKYILQELNKTNVQKELRGFGIETLTNTLGKKPAGQTFADIAGIWGTLDQRKQGAVSTLLGGRFNAARVPLIFENYDRVLQLAVDSQLNLNKAQDANVKIVDTLRKQLEGLKAAYDALLISTAKHPLTSLGADDPMRMLTRSAQTAKNAMLLAERFPASVGIGEELFKVVSPNAGKLGTINNMMRWFNLAAEYYLKPRATSPIAGEDAYQTQRAEWQKQMNVSGPRLQLFGMARTKLLNGTMTPEAANIYAETMQQMTGGQANATAFLNAKSPEARLAVIDRVRAQAALEQAQAKWDAFSAAKKHGADLESQHNTLDATITQKISLGKAHDEESKKLQVLDDLIQKNKADTDDLSVAYESEAGTLDAVLEQTQKYISLLKITGDVASRIGGMAGQSTEQQTLALRMQLDYLGQQYRSVFNNREFGALERGPVIDKILEQIRSAQAAYDAVAETRYDPLDRTVGGPNAASSFNRGLERGARGAGYVSTASDYGIDSADKLLHQRKALTEDLTRTTEQLAAAEAAGLDTSELMGRQLKEQISLQQNLLDLKERQAGVERDIHQFIADQHKEAMRSFFGAGPAEMLQKLAAFRMAFDKAGKPRAGLSQGGFFAMDPAMRQSYGQYNPEYSPQMIELKNERRRIEAELAALNQAKTGAAGAAPGNVLAGGKTMAQWLQQQFFPKGAPGSGHDAAAVAAGEAVKAITNLKTGAQAAADFLAGDFIQLVRGALAQLTPPAGGWFNAAAVPAPVLAQSGGNGGGRGFTR